MNVPDLRDAAAQFIAPLKAPVAALGGGLIGLEASDLLAPGGWLAAAGILALVLVIRSVLFFEFRAHERKEKQLYEAVLATSRSFDAVIERLRHDIDGSATVARRAEAKAVEVAASVAGVDGRLRIIEGSPLISRALRKEGAAP